MKIYNGDKTQIITNPDLSLGRLIPDKLQTGTTEEIAEQGKYIRSEPDAQGYVHQEYVVTVAPKPAEPTYEDIQVYLPWTAEELKANRIAEIKNRLTSLSEDIIQDSAGEMVPAIIERKAEFITLHNELRVLKGLEPREVEL